MTMIEKAIDLFMNSDMEWTDAVKAVEAEENAKFIPACQFVQKMKRKHHANPAWVWDVLGDNGIIKGHGHILSAEEQADIEAYIIDGLK